MLLLGFLSLCQISFLPGYLCLRSFRLPVRGLLQTSIYSFGLTLIANHSLVYALYSAGLYSRPVVYALVALEWLTLFYLMRRERFHLSVSLPSEETLDRYRALWRDRPLSGRLITIPAFAALLAGAAFCYQYFGSVYLLVDDVLSWDRWAMEWAGNRLSRTGLYPQLLPTNWSLTYVMLGNTDVKMFAKAIMPLFTLATLLLFLDLFHKTGRLTWLLSLSGYAFLLCFFFQPVFLASGYAELASAFFAFLTLYTFLQPEAGRSRPILVAVFASGTLLTKQGGVYVFALALGWLAFDFARRSDTRTWRAPALALILLVNCRWVVTGWLVTHGQESSNIAFLTRDIHDGRTYPQRWQTAWRMIERVRGLEVAPLIWLAAGVVLLSLFHPQGRLVFLLLFAPFYVLWALLFSYETRTLAMDLPFAAYCLACGAAVVAGCCLRVGRFAGSLFPQSSPPHPAYSWLRALRWLLPGGILATLILSGEAARTGVSVSHWWRSSRWLMDMGATWKWPLAAGCCPESGKIRTCTAGNQDPYLSCCALSQARCQKPSRIWSMLAASWGSRLARCSGVSRRGGWLQSVTQAI